MFTRRSAAIAEKEARDDLISKMESQLATIVATGDVEAQGASVLSEMITRLRDTPTQGRVAIEADPAILIVNTNKDITLQPGDSLVIPVRPSSVTVVGEVLSPSSFHFDPKLDSSDYVNLAGGFGRFADKRHAFVVMPDGRSQKFGKGRLGLQDKMLAPGAIIVVPRNLRPFQWNEFLASMTQISSQMALTAASVSVVARNNQ